MPELNRRVLGVGGLALAREYKRRRFPELGEREHAIVQGADAAAALVIDDRVVAAAAEERFNGVKHSEAFPVGASEFCLAWGGVAAADLDVVAHSFSYGPERALYRSLPEYYRTMYDEVLDPAVNRALAEKALGVDLGDRFVPVPHHLAHAASTYVPSGFDDALVLVTDGLGERQSATVLAASQHGFDPLLEVSAANSLGLLYGLFTLYLGFWFGDGEYKVMGLAPYGDPARYADLIKQHWVHLEPDGRYLVPLLFENETVQERETYEGSLRAVEARLGPRRAPGAPLEQRHVDLAASLQAVLQECQLHLLRHMRRETGLRRLCIAGGVGLNCVANGVVLRSGLFDDMYVQPAAGDDGAAMGAALYAAGSWSRPVAPFTPLLGPEYGREDCESAVRQVPDLDIRVLAEDDLVAAVACALADGEVVGWFQGRMELGPRALGNRSILADPRREDMRDRINELVKMRESFRPFAPAVTTEHATEWFDVAPEHVRRFSDMLFVADVLPERAGRLPAVTHVDGSARVQTVSREANPIFWKLIREFGRLTGVPVVLNTSFNVQGQAIVRTPQDAVDTFLRARLDALVVGGLLIRRSPKEGSWTPM